MSVLKSLLKVVRMSWPVGKSKRISGLALYEVLKSKTVVNEDGCWIWTGRIGRSKTDPNKDGYGRYGRGGDGVTTLAYRLMYEVTKGQLPEGWEPDHLCRVRACINPDHLEGVPRYENMLRGESLPAQNVRKTHCKYGHEFTDENTRVYTHTYSGNPMRQCVTCQNARRSGVGL